MTLYELPLGKECYIKSVNTDVDIKRRMLDMGLIAGTKVKCMYVAPFGEPKAYLVRGTILALRSDDTKKIKVIAGEKIE